jgi:hypothetical protein
MVDTHSFIYVSLPTMKTVVIRIAETGVRLHTVKLRKNGNKMFIN